MAQITSIIAHGSENQPGLLSLKNAWRLSALILIFFLATLLRLKNITAPGELVEREYNSAIVARDFYFDNNPEIETWRQEIAHTLRERQFILEPPVTEYIVSIIYRIIGKEELWYARPVASAFWLIGGIFMYKLARRILLTTNEALVAAAYYLLVPAGITISRSFQPDALMMMFYLISLYFISMYFDRPSFQKLLVAALFTGLTLLLRPLVLFALFCVFISLSVYRRRSWRILLDWHFTTFFIISLVLPAAYYGYGTFIAGFLRGQTEISFRPYLLFLGEFWEWWFFLGVSEIGFVALLAALPGFWLLQKGLSKAFIIGLGVGYIIFGLVFTYHIQTHPYYHIQLIPLVGICIAPLIAYILDALKGTGARFWWLPAIAAFIVILMFTYKQVVERVWSQVFENSSMSRQIGEVVHHSDRSVFVAYHYGLPLQYYGELSGTFWPRRLSYWLVPQPGEVELSVKERIDSLNFDPEYFIITNFKDYSTYNQDLQAYLVKNCSLLAQTDQYLIYHECKADGS